MGCDFWGMSKGKAAAERRILNVGATGVTWIWGMGSAKGSWQLDVQPPMLSILLAYTYTERESESWQGWDSFWGWQRTSVRLVLPFGVDQNFLTVSYWGMGYL